MVRDVSKTISYRNFGYLPRQSRLYNAYAALFGNPNLHKRLQAPDIMEALNIQPSERVLDFACGTGFFTVEMAKLAKQTYGIDINPAIKTLCVPPSLKDKLFFQQADGRKLDFNDGYFDKILASEIIAFIPDKDSFFLEFNRILNSGGHLVICNSSGHPVLQSAYEENSFGLRVLKALFKTRVPESYEDYCGKINHYFGNENSAFMSLEEVTDLAQKHGFTLKQDRRTPRKIYGNYLSWLQFIGFVLRQKPLLRFGFIPHYFLFSLLGLKSKKGFEGGLLLTFEKEG